MITSIDQVTQYPLCWPENKPRAAKRITQRFSWNATLATAMAKVEAELARVGARFHVISMAPAYRRGANREDPGVAVWWVAKKTGDLRVLACDKFEEASDNLYAIGLTIDRLRAIDRYGAYTAEQAVEGARLSLPVKESNSVNWRATFAPVPTGLPDDELLAVMERRYRTSAAAAGEGGLAVLNRAIEAARKELKRESAS